MQAKKFMYEKHKGQRYGKHPFVIHPLEVYLVIELLFPADSDMQAAALLHDILEDTDVSYKKLRELFGASIANLVEEVTKDEKGNFPHLKTTRGICLKIADWLCNTSHADSTPHLKEKYYKRAKRAFKR